MICGPSSEDIQNEDLLHNILKRRSAGWSDYSNGQWRFLTEFAQTRDQFEEIEVILQPGQESTIPIKMSDKIKIIHLTLGSSLTVTIDNATADTHILSKHDCLVIGSQLDFRVKCSAETGFDITQVVNNPLHPEFENMVKYIAYDELEVHEFLGNGSIQRFKVLVHPDLLDNLLSRNLFIVEPGEKGPPFHTHPTYETFRMLEESAPIEVALATDIPRQMLLFKGDYLNVAPDQVHSFRNLSDEQAHLVATLCPAGAERTFLKFSQLYAEKKQGKISEDEYIERMNQARREGCFITRAPGSWK